MKPYNMITRLVKSSLVDLVRPRYFCSTRTVLYVVCSQVSLRVQWISDNLVMNVDEQWNVRDEIEEVDAPVAIPVEPLLHL